MRAQLIQLSPLTATDLEIGLSLLGIDVLADTIDQFWSPIERADVLVWIAGTHAARKLGDNSLAPTMPAVLVPFFEASRLQEAI